MRAAEKFRTAIPAGDCPTCWSRWSRSLAAGACVCTGTVTLGWASPMTHHTNTTPTP